MFTRTGRKRSFEVVTVHMGKGVDILEMGSRGARTCNLAIGLGEGPTKISREWSGLGLL